MLEVGQIQIGEDFLYFLREILPPLPTNRSESRLGPAFLSDRELGVRERWERKRDHVGLPSKVEE
jgi:hypothetical protein